MRQSWREELCFGNLFFFVTCYCSHIHEETYSLTDDKKRDEEDKTVETTDHKLLSLYAGSDYLNKKKNFVVVVQADYMIAGLYCRRQFLLSMPIF